MKQPFLSFLRRVNPLSFIVQKITGKPATWTTLPTVTAKSSPFDFLYGDSMTHDTRHQTVAVEPCDSYTLSEVTAAVNNALLAINFTIPRHARVLIKPNVLARNRPDQCATTHPSVIDAICSLCAKSECSITIGDSSAFYQTGGTARNFETSGIATVAKKYGARLLPFEKASLRRVSSGQAIKTLWISNAVYEHDLIINVPKLKVHRHSLLSGAIKNMYGCIPGGTKQVYHELFQYREDYRSYWGEPLVDVYNAADPELSIMDAVYGLDKDGPAATGVPRKAGVILASTNGALLDVAASQMVGFDPKQVPAVRAALERGSADDRQLTIVGTLPSVPFTKPVSRKPSALSDYFFHQVIMKPVVRRSKCASGCMRCENVCKPGAISFDKSGYADIDYQRCIRCYCCAEQCPHDAISLKGTPVNRLIRLIRDIKKV